MKIFLQILKWILISILGFFMILVIGYFVYFGYFDKIEMNQIKKDLNKIENVEVLEIGGYGDFGLDVVSARVKIKNKGEIDLHGLNKDVFSYPKRVIINEIGGYSFKIFQCDGRYRATGSQLNIGTESELFPLINKEFKTAKEVIENYDLILEKIKSLKKSPEINHFETKNSELYLLVSDKKTFSQDSIFNLIGKEMIDYEQKLKYNNSNCY